MLFHSLGRAAGWALFTSLVVVSSARAESPVVATPTPATAPAPANTTPAAPTPTNESAAAATPPTEKAEGWSPEEITAAKARCEAVLKSLDVALTIEEPVRDGQCGTPMPVKLTRIGSVTFAPAPTLTCDMVAGLAKWIKHDLQPLARAHLGGPVTGISTMSSYSCRNAYGREDAHLSQHGKANAIDIGGFSTQHDTAMVLASWGPIAREVKAQVAKDEALKRAAEAKARTLEAKNGAKPQLRPAEPGKQFGTQPSISTSALRPAVDIELPLKPSLGISPSIGFAPPQHLGGPEGQPSAATTPTPAVPAKPAASAAAVPVVPAMPDETEAHRMQFLRLAHDTACVTFSTVLGPEANGYHRNHFHLDLSDRKSKPICE
jgi:hypothetical protein